VADSQGAVVSALRAEGASMAEIVQVVELASQAWRHEARGRGGRWTGSGMATATDRPGHAATHPQTAPHPPRLGTPTQRREAARQRLASQGRLGEKHPLAPVQQQHVAALAAEVKQRHEAYVQEHQAAESAKEQHNAAVKFFAALAAIIGGAVLAIIEAHFGVSNISQILTAISPAIADALFERIKKL
jgi:hypothetical protein